MKNFNVRKPFMHKTKKGLVHLTSVNPPSTRRKRVGAFALMTYNVLYRIILALVDLVLYLGMWQNNTYRATLSRFYTILSHVFPCSSSTKNSIERRYKNVCSFCSMILVYLLFPWPRPLQVLFLPCVTFHLFISM